MRTNKVCIGHKAFLIRIIFLMMMYYSIGDIKINLKILQNQIKKAMSQVKLYYRLIITYILIVDMVEKLLFNFKFNILMIFNIGDEMGGYSWCGEYKTWYNIL